MGKAAGLIGPVVAVELAIPMSIIRKLVESIFQKLTVLIYRGIVVRLEIAVASMGKSALLPILEPPTVESPLGLKKVLLEPVYRSM